MSDKNESIWEDIGFGKHCQCGQHLLGKKEKESGVCGFCYKPTKSINIDK